MKLLLPGTLSLILLSLPLLPHLAAAEGAPAGGSARIRGVLQPYVENHTLAGAVTLVADKDRILSVDTVGFQDIARQKPMRPDCLFWIASQSKPITAAAFMMLVDEGKIQLDDPVEKYLPEFHNQWLAVEKDGEHVLLRKPAHPIKVREILSHTSGLPFSSALEGPTLDLFPLRVGARSYAMSPLEYQPGTRYQYANAGINTAGRIIEVVSGMPFETFLQKRLFDPLGMTDTTFWPHGEQLARIARSYKPNKEGDGLEETTVTQLRYPLDDRTRQPMPAGGLFSTARDVARFCQMVLNHGSYEGKRYLSPEAVSAMTSKQTGDAVKEGYGLGWSVGGGNFGHGGAYSTNMTIDTHSGLIKVFLVQHAGFPKDGASSRGAFEHAADEEFGGRK